MKPCTSCTNPITEKRLAALPNASTCIVCANAAETVSIANNCRNMERLGRLMVSSEDSYEAKRPRRTRLSTGGISQAMELGI